MRRPRRPRPPRRLAAAASPPRSALRPQRGRAPRRRACARRPLWTALATALSGAGPSSPTTGLPCRVTRGRSDGSCVAAAAVRQPIGVPDAVGCAECLGRAHSCPPPHAGSSNASMTRPLQHGGHSARVRACRRDAAALGRQARGEQRMVGRVCAHATHAGCAVVAGRRAGRAQRTQQAQLPRIPLCCCARARAAQAHRQRPGAPRASSPAPGHALSRRRGQVESGPLSTVHVRLCFDEVQLAALGLGVAELRRPSSPALNDVASWHALVPWCPGSHA